MQETCMCRSKTNWTNVLSLLVSLSQEGFLTPKKQPQQQPPPLQQQQQQQQQEEGEQQQDKD